VEHVQDSVTTSADFTVYENRFGGRSWFPLFGMGKFGVTAGVLMSGIQYKVSATRNLVAIDPIPFTIAANTPIWSDAKTLSGWWLGLGAFAGTDLEIQFSPRFFGRIGVDYSWYTGNSIKVLNIETTINPGGFGSIAAVGIGF